MRTIRNIRIERRKSEDAGYRIPIKVRSRPEGLPIRRCAAWLDQPGKESDPVKRLPEYDNHTGRLELVAYLALGLAGATLTGLSFFNGASASSGPNALVSSPSTQRIEMVNEAPGKEVPPHLTNIILLQSPTSSGQAPPART